MYMKRSLMLVLLVAVVAGIGGVAGSIITINLLQDVDKYPSIAQRQQMVLTSTTRDSAVRVPAGLDFLDASRLVTPGVVHIRTAYGPGDFSFNPLQAMDNPTRSSGSGVIISDDGYIATNNHVIEDATTVEVVMNNNKRYYAKVVGTDPSTDLALLKIKEKNLPFVRYGDSDNLLLGEWVLAIGNPFNLNSTVTAGIVSAKARNIGILRERNSTQVEAFIQTDAAVNPGNSGGALVNLKGELIGINTAIATSNGSYQGYSFAVPVNLVKKVMDDLLEFGSVQRGLLGIQIDDMDALIAESFNIPVSQGVLINGVNENSAASEAGLEAGDVIVGIDDRIINSVSELQEWVARKRPGTDVRVAYLRKGQKRETIATLKNIEGLRTVGRKAANPELEGAIFENVPYKDLAKLMIDGGVRLKTLGPGKWKDGNVPEGFIVAFIDKVPIESLDDLNNVLSYKRGGVLIEGFYASGKKGTFGIDW